MQRLRSKINVKKNSDAGFTLIEMSIVMVVVGIVVSIMMTVMPSILKTAKIKEARAGLERINNSILGYLISTGGQLPYADTNGDGEGNDGAVYYGWLPYIDLGLSAGNDVWGNPIKYGVYEEVTANTVCDISQGDNPVLNRLYTDYVTVPAGTRIQTPKLYVIISGGDATGVFENYNADNNAQYDDPERKMAYNPANGQVVYNDIVIAGGINSIKGLIGCTLPPPP